MFHWICPECGREIAPQERECPACDARATTAESMPIRAAEPVQHAPIQPAPPVEVLARTLKKQVQARTLKKGPVSPPGVVPGDAVPSTGKTLTNPPVAGPVKLSTGVAGPAASESIPWPDEGDLQLPEWSRPATTGNGLADAIHAMGLAGEPQDPPVYGKLAVPLTGPATAGTSGRGIWTALDLQPVPAAQRAPMASDDLAKRGPAPPQPHVQAAASLPWPRTKPKVIPRVTLPDAVAPVANAPRQPQSVNPEFAPGAADLAVYSPLAGKPMRAIAPHQNAVTTDCLPRVTLPGPMLIKRLISFRDRELVPQFPEGQAFKKPLLPRWAWMGLVGLTLLSAGFGSVISLLPSRTAPEKTSVAVSVAASRMAARVSANPLSKAIEVTGFRILMNHSNKSEIQYLVVNHSATRFSGVTVFVTLRGANAQRGEPALCRFAFASPDLGPFEAREMSSQIEKLNRPVALPDWQDVRAEIEIGE